MDQFSSLYGENIFFLLKTSSDRLKLTYKPVSMAVELLPLFQLFTVADEAGAAGPVISLAIRLCE
jgi:hypothetical protein